MDNVPETIDAAPLTHSPFEVDKARLCALLAAERLERAAAEYEDTTRLARTLAAAGGAR